MDQEERREDEVQTMPEAEGAEETAREAPEQPEERGSDPMPEGSPGSEGPGPDSGAWEEPLALRERLEAERQALAAERSAFEREKLENRVGRALEQRGLGREFALWLTGADEAESLERVEQFDKLFQRRLRRELEKRLGGGTAPREPRPQRGYTREALRRMSPREINRNWDEIVRTLEG